MVKRINITIPLDLKEKLDSCLEDLSMTRSKFFAIAAYQYYKELTKKRIRQALEEGYAQMCSESEEIASEAFNIQREVIEDL